jgi:hypothetical protein
MHMVNANVLEARSRAHTCNSNMWKIESGGLKVQSQPGLHNETLSQKYQGLNKGRTLA